MAKKKDPKPKPKDEPAAGALVRPPEDLNPRVEVHCSADRGADVLILTLERWDVGECQREVERHGWRVYGIDPVTRLVKAVCPGCASAGLRPHT